MIYIIRENRTYDQILGDLGAGDGDPSLTMYGKDITPNVHKLALQFGVLDNFYDSGEVSGDGHVWSTAGITSDYNERNWQQAYRGGERTYDFEGVVAERLSDGGKDLRHQRAGQRLPVDRSEAAGKDALPLRRVCLDQVLRRLGRGSEAEVAARRNTGADAVLQGLLTSSNGEQIPANYGGGDSPYPWKIPLIYRNVATKPELEGHFDPAFPDFNLHFPDQLRVNEFLTHFNVWVNDRMQGRDTMPSFVMLRLPNDHTAGTRPGSPTPKASVADNDLAVGRAVEAVSNSPYWDDTAFFILEDDAQDGADHVDAHRSVALVISKYSPRQAQPLVDHDFYTTVSILRTMEDLLGHSSDEQQRRLRAAHRAALCRRRGSACVSPPTTRTRPTASSTPPTSEKAPGAKESSRMDFTHEDRADARKLNVILWKDAMGNKPVPWMVLHPHGEQKKDDDD